YGAGGSATGGVNDITNGPDGAVWYTANWTVVPTTGAQAVVEDIVGRVTPNGTFTQFSVPSTTNIGGIITGPDGNLWFTGTNVAANDLANGAPMLYRMTPQGQLAAFDAPAVPVNAPLGGHNELTAGPDGNIWLSTPGGIARANPSGQFTVF